MAMVFLSYSTKDHLFAELASIKLEEAGIRLWRDRGQIRPGTDWRSEIERGIGESIAVLVALSTSSAQSSYVTFECSYGLGKGKPPIPIKLEECDVHPRLRTVQHIDFSNPGVLPWPSLIERIREIEADATPQDDLRATEAAVISSQPALLDPTVKAILGYLNQRGYQMASFERLRRRLDESLTDQRFNAIIAANPNVFRHAVLKEGKPGLAKREP